MRFIHAADIHLDSPLVGLSAYEDAPTEMLRTATREAFVNLVSAAIDEEVDFMVIAGDLYDGNWKDYNTGLFFVAQMGRLKRAGIPVYLLHGNHDAESEMTRKLLLPDNVHVFDARKPCSYLLDRPGVALHGRSFKVAATTENLAAAYPDPVPGMFNIGVLHTALEGNAAHATYAPCSLAELQAKGYQYWALGHVHEYTVHAIGDALAVFPGNLQGRNIRETGPKGAVLVTVDDAGRPEVERLLVDVLRWQRLEVDVGACASFEQAVRAIGAELERLNGASPSDHPLALRVEVVGRSEAHGQLFGLERRLREEVLAQLAALGHDRLWLEKVKLATAPPARRQAPSGDHAEALSELRNMIAEAHTDEAFVAGLRAALMGLVAKAPHELQDEVEWFRDIRAGDVSGLLREVAPGLMAQLDAEE
ncbi:metallophosphoesterase [Parapusillimonas granuli]|uniref:DNA repair exonuclease n=1 Tax=Parapusillimonas granuli TaxID=380911 RepID=A0A853FZD3_9BURK|nr:DNA repair exonuclease SbcCD nuclease subunit [Parapusillimonas granuli]NYT50278.1 DNA repair exonuclease [Parapusillimonas granuli]